MKQKDLDTKIEIKEEDIIRDKIHVEFEMEQQMSPQAKKMGDEYYELKVQLRFTYFSKEELEEDHIIIKRDKYGNPKYKELVDSNGEVILDEKGEPKKEIIKIKEEGILHKFGKLVEKQFDGINKIDELDKGFDFFFASLGSMHKVSRYFNKYYYVDDKHSKKIVGKNFLESKDIWRHTLLINVINLDIGDRVRIKGIDYYIKAFNKKEMVLRNWEDGSKEVVTYAKVRDYFELVEKFAWSKQNGKMSLDTSSN